MEYKSKSSLCGLPLVHIITGGKKRWRAGNMTGAYKRGIAKAWIAIGDISYGVLFSCGGVAVGGIAIGGVSLGVLSIAGAAFGVFTLGGLAVGLYAMGGAAVAKYLAVGGFAKAVKYAIGGTAIAEQANNEIAMAALKSSWFFTIGNAILKYSQWCLLLVLIPITLIISGRLKKQ